MYHRAKGYSHAAEKILVVDGAVVREDYTEHYPPDTRAAEFLLTNRHPGKWKSKRDGDEPGPEGGGPQVRVTGGLPETEPE